jgi:hypothetical protein
VDRCESLVKGDKNREEAAAVSRFREMALMREQLRNAEFKSRSSARRDTEVGGARRAAGDTAAVGPGRYCPPRHRLAL